MGGVAAPAQRSPGDPAVDLLEAATAHTDLGAAGAAGAQPSPIRHAGVHPPVPAAPAARLGAPPLGAGLAARRAGGREVAGPLLAAQLAGRQRSPVAASAQRLLVAAVDDQPGLAVTGAALVVGRVGAHANTGTPRCRRGRGCPPASRAGRPCRPPRARHPRSGGSSPARRCGAPAAPAGRTWGRRARPRCAPRGQPTPRPER